MQILTNLPIEINGDQVLRAQGADPSVIRARNRGSSLSSQRTARTLAAIADQAVQVGRPMLQPAVALCRIRVEGVRHEKLILAGGGSLTGALVARQLGLAGEVILAVCTIGAAVETKAHEEMGCDPVFGLALDGFGSAAAEALAKAACEYIARQVEAEGLKATIPFGPGMDGWPVESGQRQIFGLLDAAQIGVTLNPASIMTPRKSVTFAVGIGSDVATEGQTCDYCNLNQTCRYRHLSSPIKEVSG